VHGHGAALFGGRVLPGDERLAILTTGHLAGNTAGPAEQAWGAVHRRAGDILDLPLIARAIEFDAHLGNALLDKPCDNGPAEVIVIDLLNGLDLFVSSDIHRVQSTK
jgi:hypothetical protein